MSQQQALDLLFIGQTEHLYFPPQYDKPLNTAQKHCLQIPPQMVPVSNLWLDREVGISVAGAAAALLEARKVLAKAPSNAGEDGGASRHQQEAWSCFCCAFRILLATGRLQYR